jgi:Tol biopolymer transport system component
MRIGTLVLLVAGTLIGCSGATGREVRQQRGLTDLGAGFNPQWTAEGRIVFSDSAGVWEMKRDGTGLRRIVDLEAGSGLLVSPDRESMLIMGGGINWVVGVDGSGLRQVTNVQASSTARWSDDSTMITFERLDGGQRSLWAVPAAGGESQQLFADHGGFVLAWANDGRMIVRAFQERAGGSWLAALLVVPGQPTKQLPMVLEHARFLPDGSIEAIEMQGGLVVLDSQGRLSHRVDLPTGTRELPDRSPDGRLLAFSGDDGVWLTDPDGRGARLLTSERCYGATFSPDGRALLCRYVRVVGVDDEGDPAHELRIGVINISAH